MRSFSLACPNASSPDKGFAAAALAGVPRSDGISEMVGGNLIGGLFLLAGVVTRASEAVEESVGVACDEETIAGTDIDLMTGFERFRAKSTSLGGSSDGDAAVAAFENGDFAADRSGFVGGASDGFGPVLFAGAST
jgi:hypothetical protein